MWSAVVTTCFSKDLAFLWRRTTAKLAFKQQCRHGSAAKPALPLRNVPSPSLRTHLERGVHACAAARVSDKLNRRRRRAGPHPPLRCARRTRDPPPQPVSPDGRGSAGRHRLSTVVSGRPSAGAATQPAHDLAACGGACGGRAQVGGAGAARQSWHRVVMPQCAQAPTQSLQSLLRRRCSQMKAPQQSLNGALRRPC